MKGTMNFKATIQAYLEERARTDELFAISYAKEHKDIDNCITYILNEVKRSGCNGFNDDEIYSMAMPPKEPTASKAVDAKNNTKMSN